MSFNVIKLIVAFDVNSKKIEKNHKKSKNEKMIQKSKIFQFNAITQFAPKLITICFYSTDNRFSIKIFLKKN